MRFTNPLRVYSSLVMLRHQKLSLYHNAGRPRRLLRDDGTDYNLDRNLSPKQADVRRQLNRLEQLEKLQFASSKAGPPCRKSGFARKPRM